MSEVSKFTFDTEFNRDGEIVRARPPRPKTRFTAEDVEEARAEGVAAGRAAAEARAAEAAAQALDALAGRLTDILGRLDGEIDGLRAEGARLAYETGTCLARAVIERHAADHVEALVADCMATLRDTPSLTIRVAEDLEAEVTPQLEAAAARTGFEGRLDIGAEAGLSGADCRLTWPDGGGVSDLKARIEEIRRIIADHLASENNTQLSLFDMPADEMES